MGQSIREEVLTSSLWMMGWQWISRFLGLISTVILARLLEPEDYGILSMGMLVVGLTETFTVLGTERYLISTSNPSVDEYNSAWTLNILQFTIAGLCLFAFSSSLSQYFNEPRVNNVIKVLALTVIISGFKNIGIVMLKKNLNFSKIFTSGIVEKVVGFIVTVAFAVLIKNYWAMVIGTLSMKIINIILSYYIHPYRPKICLKKSVELLSFSKWIILSNIAIFIRNKLDQLLISKFFSVDNVGIYSMALDVAKLPTNDVATPLYETIFSGFGKLVEDNAALSRAFLTANGAFACIIFPLATGLALVAENIVIIFLSDKWISIVPYLQWLLLMGTCMALTGVSRDILVILRKVKLITYIHWGLLTVMFPCLLYTAMHYSMLCVVIVRTVMALLLTSFFWLIVSRAINLPFARITQSIIRPSLAVSCMAVSLIFFCPTWEHNKLLTLCVHTLVGAITYCATLYIFWNSFGKPRGGEQVLFDFIIKRFSKRKN